MGIVIYYLRRVLYIINYFIPNISYIRIIVKNKRNRTKYRIKLVWVIKKFNLNLIKINFIIIFLFM